MRVQKGVVSHSPQCLCANLSLCVSLSPKTTVLLFFLPHK